MEGARFRGQHFVELPVFDARVAVCDTCDARVENRCAAAQPGSRDWLDVHTEKGAGKAHRREETCPKGRWPGERPTCASLGRPLNLDEAKEMGIDASKCGCLNRLRKCAEHRVCTTGERVEGFACCAGCPEYESSDPTWEEPSQPAQPAQQAASGRTELAPFSESPALALTPDQLQAVKDRALARVGGAAEVGLRDTTPIVHPPSKSVHWAVGVMACEVPAPKLADSAADVARKAELARRRSRQLLPQTLKSLVRAGWPPQEIRVFVDGCADPVAFKAELVGRHPELDRVGITARWPALGVHGNWLLTLHELFLRDRLDKRGGPGFANRFAVFQDDCLAARNLRAYLERCPYPEMGYLNLMCLERFKNRSNELEEPHGPRPPGHMGWYLSNQNGIGAVGLVFDFAAAMQLMSSEMFVRRPEDPARGMSSVDGGIVWALGHEAGKPTRQEWVHYPSLVYHAGEESTIGNSGWRSHGSAGFNEFFDPLTLLPPRPPGPAGETAEAGRLRAAIAGDEERLARATDAGERARFEGLLAGYRARLAVEVG